MAVITSPITGKEVADASVGDVMGMLYEDLSTIIENAGITLRYPEFERTYGEWGALLTEGRIAAAQGENVDADATAMAPPAYFTVDARYYDEWIEAVYPSEIRRVDVTKILRGEMDYADFLRKVVQRNVEGYRADVNKSIDDALVGTGVGDSQEKPRALIDVYAGDFVGGFLGHTRRYDTLSGEDGGAPKFKDVYSAILATAMHMEVENSTFTEGDAVYGASMDDLSIYLPIDFVAGSDIKYIQELFNKSGIDKLPNIRAYNDKPITIGIGETAKTYNVAFILDKRVLNHVQRYMSYDDAPNDTRKSERLSLHVEHMTKYSPFYKAWAFLFEMPTE